MTHSPDTASSHLTEQLRACLLWLLAGVARRLPPFEPVLVPVRLPATLRLRNQLPRIPLPLRSGEADAHLDLQHILHRTYDSAGYEVYIYRGRPQPQLRPEDAVWAQTFVPPPPVGSNGAPA